MQFVTFRLADSLPTDVVTALMAQTEGNHTDGNDAVRRKRYEHLLDSGYGGCILAQPSVRAIVEEALHFRIGRNYDLHAYVIMPNHVHVLMTLYSEQHLIAVIRDLKSHTARAINRALGSTGRVWGRDYYDRYIRDKRHEIAVRDYIANNPVSAGLVKESHKFVGSSSALPWTG